MLRGKTVPIDVTLNQLKTGGVLTPETCGWHYQEGLTLRDHECALFWDKAGLGHNGERLAGGGHIVTFVNGDKRHVKETEWQAFVAEQASLKEEAIRRKAQRDEARARQE